MREGGGTSRSDICLQCGSVDPPAQVSVQSPVLGCAGGRVPSPRTSSACARIFAQQGFRQGADVLECGLKCQEEKV